MGPKIFNIASGIPFARALAEGVAARVHGDPLALADALIFVPTRRAARTLREAFVAAQGGASLGPHIRALGDVGEEDFTFDPSADDLDLLPAIAPLRRRLLLAALVQRWSEDRGTPLGLAQAAAHAGELARFLDEAKTQGADLAKLDGLAPGALAAHWQEVVKFLRIIAVEWPNLLTAEGAVEPVERRDIMLRRLAARLAANPPRGPVIAAGSTGSIPATAELLKTIAHLPDGAVVLPGLDIGLDAESWKSLEPSHAQYGLRELLARLGAEREDVKSWPRAGEPMRTARARFLSEALRPPPTTDAWRDLAAHEGAGLAPGLDGLALVEAAHPREEALVIACALREVLETPGRTAALVTPDRGLARRVAAELSRWNIDIDDSAGVALSRTPPGAFLALLARAAAENFAPVPLLALLKHPLAAGGEPRAQFLRRVRALEILCLRGLRPEPGLMGLAAALIRRNAPADLMHWFARSAEILQPFAEAIEAGGTTLADIARAHAQAAETLAATTPGDGAANLWRGPAGEAAANLLAELGRDGGDIGLGDNRQYAEFFRDLAETHPVRSTYGRHPRLAILGLLEARLQHFDLVVLGGLNEGTWPGEAATDPWLSRPMRKQLGLEPPERRIGLAAHDFASLAAAPNVLLTRARKEAGAPTVASRWLLRLKQLAKGLGLEAKLAPCEPLLAWARALDDVPRGRRPSRARRPAPAPPPKARPRRLSVTEIETWLRDPYAVYARRVLRLEPLDPIDAEPGAAERGIAVHKALERFLLAFPGTLPADALERLIAFGEEEFAAQGADAAALALWRPRFARAARWFLAYESVRRPQILRSLAEQKDELKLAAAGGEFTLVGRADRIDLLPEHRAAIVDYKTGRLPGHEEVSTLLSPQLPLEAAMLLKGCFGDLGIKGVRALIYLQLTGAEPPGRERIVNVIPDAKAAEALTRLDELVARYDAGAPYRSRVMPKYKDMAGDYDHLARVREWSVYGEADE